MATPYRTALHVLIVDDEPLLRWALANALADEGHAAVEAATAHEARQAALRMTPLDVVILDWRLPDSADFQLLVELRQLAPDAAILMVTAHADAPGFAGDAYRFGADRVLVKPLDIMGVPDLVAQANRCRPI